MWDVDLRTAVAQAEIEDREQEGQYHRIAFDREDGGVVEIETSRPDSKPKCLSAASAIKVAVPPVVLPATFLPLRSRGPRMSFLLMKDCNGRSTAQAKILAGAPRTIPWIMPLTAAL